MNRRGFFGVLAGVLAAVCSPLKFRRQLVEQAVLENRLNYVPPGLIWEVEWFGERIELLDEQGYGEPGLDFQDFGTERHDTHRQRVWVDGKLVYDEGAA